MVLLQNLNAEFTQSHLMEYGILGLIAFILGYFAWMQYQRLVAKNDALELKVDRLQDEMMQMLAEERDRMAKLIQDNTEALNALQKTIFKYMIKNGE